MKFTEFTVSTTSEAQEIISDVMWSFTNYGVAICDVNDIIELIEKRRSTWDYIDEKLSGAASEKSTEVLVKAYVPTEKTEEVSVLLRKRLDEIAENSKGYISVGSLETVKRTVDGDDWIEIWRKHYRPMLFGKVWVCPEWLEKEVPDDKIKVRIDSNMAFGTGEHETTSMVIEMMQEYIKPSDTVIDVGCGSGILGIAAVKLGAAHAILTDIDFVAVKSAEHNCMLNGVSDKTTVALANLLDDTSVKGELIVANITAEVLGVLARGILKNIKEKGILIMSGIIRSRYDFVLKTYSDLGFNLIEKRQKGEWISMAMRKE